MNELQTFKNNSFGEIRTVLKDGEPLFIAADVCKALDISKYRDAVSRLDSDERESVEVDTLGGTQRMTAVTESGLYALVLGSRKPEAKAFKRWITHEVIPTIRKTGGYVSNEQAFIETYLTYLRRAESDPAFFYPASTKDRPTFLLYLCCAGA
jgi:anti-repressor protein